MSVTTLHDFLKPLPGELKITANSPEATVEITQSEDVKKAAEGKHSPGGASELSPALQRWEKRRI
jgi:hypothetical protein